MSYSYKEIPIGLRTVIRPRRYTGSWSIFRPAVDQDTCIKCGQCVIFCPENAIKLNENIEFDYNYCKGCGICANECPVTAISMVREEVE
jgi:2-oxoacid:acceptor oxidoreductase delta subunit (pyruvate/2-ketoisovalerate family)